MKLSLALFALSLPLPAFHFEHHAPVRGGELLLWGWWGLTMMKFGWLANLFYVTAAFMLQFGGRRVAAVLAACAIPIALQSLTVTRYFFNEANSTPVRSFGVAFYVWVAAIVLLAVTAAQAGFLSPVSRREGLERLEPTGS